MDIDAVILDMDGLMLDTEHLYQWAWQAAASELGFELEDSFYLSLVGRTNAAGEVELAKRFGAGFDLALFRERWGELWRSEASAHGIPHKPGLSELLEYLAGCGLPTAVATSSDRGYTEFSLRSAGLDERRFAAIVTGEEVKNGKPAPDIYLEAVRRLGVEAGCSLAVEDSDNGVLAAARAGTIAVMVPDLKAPSAEARRTAYRVLASLDEVKALLE